MKNKPTPLGHARVYKDPRSGQLIVDTDSLRRTHFAGGDFAGGYEDDDFEGYEDDDFEGYEDDDFEGYEDEAEDDFGFFRRNPERRRKRRQRRLARRRQRLGRRMGRKSARIDRKEKKLQDPSTDGWGATAVSDSGRIDQAGNVTLKIRLQHDFRAKDITCTGSAAGARVHGIFFGDRPVFSSSDGIDASVFAANGLLRDLLKGQSLKAGLDIIVNGSLPGPGMFTATLIGAKPVSGGC